jgi:CheY-like chemotaxis protein
MKPPTVLYVDDSADDMLLMKLACRNAQVSFQLQWAANGEAAIAYLKGSDAFADRKAFPFPHLILLDLKMPAKSGFDVLEWLRSQEFFRELPVVVFTSSVQEEDRTRAFELGAREFLVKPVSYRALQDLVRAIDSLLATGGSLDFGTLQQTPVPGASTEGS